MRRKTKAPIDDRPVPWEERPISRERWQRHRDWMMAGCGAGHRAEEWWLYEKGRARPKNETQVLREMGELRGGELAQCMKWWRMDYDDANDGRTPAGRQAYLDSHDVPPDLVELWDAEKAKGAA
jgi:hypothetical protein